MAVHRYRLVGPIAALILSVVVAVALFVIMARLVRAPSPAHRDRQAVTLVPIALPPSPAEQQAHRERTPTEPRTRRPPPAAPRLPSRAPRIVPRPSLPLRIVPPRPAAVTEALLTMSRVHAPTDWREAMRNYFGRRSTDVKPFQMPTFPVRRPTPEELPLRVRVPGALEIDRIGDDCYVTPAPNAPAPMKGTRAYRQWLAGLPVFVHVVPCFPARHLSLGDDFLRRLRERSGAGTSSGD